MLPGVGNPAGDFSPVSTGATRVAPDDDGIRRTPMTIEMHQTTAVATESVELLRAMLEERFALHTSLLTQLTMCGRLPDLGGYDRQTLDAVAATSRRAIADTARALRSMSEGTYGRCEDCGEPIPLGRLHAEPHTRHCTRCQRPRPE